MTITTKGRELAELLVPALPDDVNMFDGGYRWTCSRICRLATTYGRLQETACCRELTAGEQRREQTIEETIRRLVQTHLPFVEKVAFGGDPRGYTVRLYAPDRRHEGRNIYNTWGGSEHGLGVPGS